MKRKIMFVVVQLTAFLAVHAQAPSIKWERIEGGSGYDEGSGITRAADGNIYVCGWFAGSFMFGGTQLNPPATGEASYIAKLRPDSTLIWVKAYGGAGFLQDIAVGADGSIYVTGTGVGVATLFLAKVDSMMNTIWSYTSSAGVNPGSGSWYPTNTGRTIIIDHGGNIITCGTFTDSLSIDTAVLRAGGGSSNAGYALKLDPAGHVIWARKGKDGGDGFTVAVDQNDNAYFGYSYRDWNTSYTSTADLDKFSPSGTKLWETRLDGVEQTFSVTDNSNVPYLAVHLRDTALLGTTSYTPAAYEETALLKMDATTGNVIWIKNFVGVPGISGSNFLTSAGYSSQLGAVVYAYGPITINGTSYTGQQLFSFDGNGNINWTSQGPSATVEGMWIDQGDIYLEGHRSISGSNNDIYIARMSQVSTSASAVHESPALKFYPNPASDRIFIDVGSSAENIQISMFNSVGEKVREIAAKTNTSITLNLAPGIYLMQYQLKGRPFTSKVLIE